MKTNTNTELLNRQKQILTDIIINGSISNYSDVFENIQILIRAHTHSKEEKQANLVVNHKQVIICRTM